MGCYKLEVQANLMKDAVEDWRATREHLAEH